MRSYSRRYGGAGMRRGLRTGAGSMSLLSWYQGTFANASGDRYIVAPDYTLYGPYAAGIAAIASIGGKRYYQSEAAATSRVADLDLWTVNGTASRTPGQAGPGNSGNTAYLFEDIGEVGVANIFRYATSGVADAVVSASLFIKRVSTSGTLTISNSASGVLGEWSVDLSLLSNDWERLTSVHPAVTEVFSWANTSGGACGYRISNASGTSDVNLWYPQIEESAYPSSPIVPLTTRAADSMLFTAAQIPSVMREGKWKYSMIMQGANSEDPPSGATAQDFTFGALPSTRGMRFEHIESARVRDHRTSTTHVTGALTYSRQQTVSTKLDTVAGSVTIEGATTGDGTTVGTTWTGLILATDSLAVGRRFDTIDDHPRGLISEPEAW